MIENKSADEHNDMIVCGKVALHQLKPASCLQLELGCTSDLNLVKNAFLKENEIAGASNLKISNY